MTARLTNIPTLETERLILRAPKSADFDVYAALMASPRAVHMGGPFNTVQAWGMFCHDVACWSLFGHGALMIERTADGVCIGQVSLSAGPLFPELELGWMLYDGFEGAGYATEAAQQLQDWAFTTLLADTIVSYTDPDNAASQAVAARLGAKIDLSAARPHPDDIIYRHPSPSDLAPEALA